MKRIREIKLGLIHADFITEIIFSLSEFEVGLFPIIQNLTIFHILVFSIYLSIHNSIILAFSLFHDFKGSVPAYVGFIIIFLIVKYQS